jgi:hypothetical protein
VDVGPASYRVFNPKPGIGLLAVVGPRHREPRKRRPREFVLICRPLALRRDWRPSLEVIRARQDETKQRETAAVQTQSDELAVDDDEGVFL